MTALLAPDDPAPVILERPDAASPFFISCDHAGNAIPRALGDLGLSPADRERHIAWDSGALGVAHALSSILDAPLVAQTYSRLVIDCNRPEAHPELIVERSEATDVPGNTRLSAAERHQRQTAIYDPYHATIGKLLDDRDRRRLQTVFISVHSFTPVYLGERRPWQIGVLYGRDDRLARLVLQHLRADDGLTVGDNEPYRIDEKDRGLPEHAIERGLLNVLFELRQDVITDVAPQRAWGSRLARVLQSAIESLGL